MTGQRAGPTAQDAGSAQHSQRLPVWLQKRLRGEKTGPVLWLLNFVLACLRRLTKIQGIDRGLGLASRAFVSCLPLLIVLGAILPLKRSTIQDFLHNKMGIGTAEYKEITQLISTRGEVRDQLSLLGFVLVLFSVLGFMRAMQHLFEDVWEVPRLGSRGTPWGLTGVFALILYFVVVIVVGALVRHLPASGFLGAVAAVAAGAALWACIPYLLLGRRIELRRLLPGALVTGTAMAVLSYGMSIYMPRSIESHVQRYGPIGVVFALLYWFIFTSYVVVGGSIIGRTWDAGADATILPMAEPVQPTKELASS